VNVVAFSAVECPEFKAYPRGRYAREHHISPALLANRASDFDVDAFGQGMSLWHGASLNETSATLSVTDNAF
jgi:hypothetical protein